MRVDELEGRVEAVNEELEQQGIDGAGRPRRRGRGAEALDELSDETLRAVSLGAAGVWLLVEPRPGPIGGDLIEAVERLATRGFRASSPIRSGMPAATSASGSRRWSSAAR